MESVFAPAQQVVKFFELFKFKLITVAVLRPPEKEIRAFSGHYFTPQDKILAFTPEEYFSESVQTELQTANAQGHGIFFTPNEGNGVGDESSRNCGKRTNITTLRALFIDTDKADAVALMKELTKIRLFPQQIIESSPGKYHFYFFIEPEVCEGDNILYWKSLQTYLSKLVPNIDKSMADTNQLLRIPLFFNTKYDPPFPVGFYTSKAIPPYNLKFLFDRLECGVYLEEFLHANTNGNGHGKKFEYPTEKLGPGERRDTICRGFIEHLMENVVPLTAPEETYLMFIDNFIEKYVDEPELFLEGGSRRQNIIQYFHDQRSRRLAIKQAKEAQAAQAEFVHQEAVAHNSLPDEFYLNFPGDLGLWTRGINTYAPSLPLELAFSAAVCICGAMKAESFRLNGAWPLINGLIIAGTGVGKSAMKKIIETVLRKAGLRGKFPQLLKFQNTVQSLHTDLYSAGGVGTVLVDESGDYLETITNRNAPGYARALKKYFKEATTGRNRGSFLHPGGSLSFQVPPIDGGFLSLWMFIQPDKFSTSLNLQDMSDGFIPRFMIFNGHSEMSLTRTLLNEEAAKEFEPDFDLEVWLEMMSGLSRYNTDEAIEGELLQVEQDEKKKSSKVKPEHVYMAQRDAIYRLRSEARLMKQIPVKLTPDAQDYVYTFLKAKETEARSVSIISANDPSLGVYARMEEMTLRLLCNAASYNPETREALVDLELAQAVITLYDFNVGRFLKGELETLKSGEEGQTFKAVLDGLHRAFKKAKQPVRMKDITLAIKNTHRPKNLSGVIAELVKRGEVWVQEREHSKAIGRKVIVYMPAMSEDAFDS